MRSDVIDFRATQATATIAPKPTLQNGETQRMTTHEQQRGEELSRKTLTACTEEGEPVKTSRAATGPRWG